MNEPARLDTNASPGPADERGSPFPPVGKSWVKVPRRPHRRVRWFLLVGFGLAVVAATWASIVFDPLGTASRAYRGGEFAAALKSAEAHLRRWPGDRSASLMAARCATRFGQLLRAEEHYRHAGPTDCDDLRNRAYGLILLHAPNRAIEVYGELITRYPGDAQSLKRLAALLMDQQHFAAAGEIGERLVRIRGQEVPGRTLMGIAHHVLKEYEEAGREFERILKLDPSLEAMPLPLPLFWDHLAIDLMAQGRDREARLYLIRALERDQDAALFELLGQTYHREGSTAEAKRCWRKALELDVRNVNAWIDLGRVSLSDQPGEAIGLLEKAAELSPDSIVVLHNLSLAYRLVGDSKASDRCHRRVAELRSRRPRGGQVLASPDGDRSGPVLSREVGS